MSQPSLPGFEPLTLATVAAGHLRAFDRWAAQRHDPEAVTPELKAKVYRECVTHAGLLAEDVRALLQDLCVPDAGDAGGLAGLTPEANALYAAALHVLHNVRAEHGGGWAAQHVAFRIMFHTLQTLQPMTNDAPRAAAEPEWGNNECDGCGGGIDRDHPTTCSACLYERATGRSYESDVDAAQAAGVTLEEYARRTLAARGGAGDGDKLPTLGSLWGIAPGLKRAASAFACDDCAAADDQVRSWADKYEQAHRECEALRRKLSERDALAATAAESGQ